MAGSKPKKLQQRAYVAFVRPTGGECENICGELFEEECKGGFEMGGLPCDFIAGSEEWVDSIANGTSRVFNRANLIGGGG